MAGSQRARADGVTGLTFYQKTTTSIYQRHIYCTEVIRANMDSVPDYSINERAMGGNS